MTNLSYSKGPEAALWDLTLAETLAKTASRFPGREALVVRQQNVRYTWWEFDQAVTQVARG